MSSFETSPISNANRTRTSSSSSRDTPSPFDKAHKCRTFPKVESTEPPISELKLLGIFSLALAITRCDPSISRNPRKRLCGIFIEPTAPCFLLGQLAKNDLHKEEIVGKEFVQMALSILMDARDLVGGRFVLVDRQDKPPTKSFYLSNGPRILKRDPEKGMCQMVRYLR